MSKEIFIKVIHTDNLGNKSNHVMNLKTYLMAKRVKPQAFEPGDEYSKKILSQINIEDVPEGTNQKDVDAFEKIRGTIKGRRKDVFQEILDDIVDGVDIKDVPDENYETGGISKINVNEMFQTKTSETKPKITLDNDDKEETKIPNDIFMNDVNVKKENEPKYSMTQLSSMAPDQLQAVIESLPIAAGMKKAVNAIKKKDEKLEQVYQLLKI